MPIITKYSEVKKIYEKAAENKWVIPCICSENLTTTEAIFEAANQFANENNIKNIPITIAITVQYSHRPQAVYYSRTRKWDIGLQLFKSDVEILSKAYPNVDVMIHLDHIQHDDDLELINTSLEGFSSIMYDASALPFEENIKKTSAYVNKMGGKIMIEGACDEIIDAGGDTHNSITTASDALKYINETGVDMIVANLGTEHRASGKDLMYHAEAAKAICDVIGSKIVLHGASSVSNNQILKLADDGVCKVNIWTALERDSTPFLLEYLVKNASMAAGIESTEKLIEEGFLTQKCLNGKKASINYFTQTAYMSSVYENMIKIVRAYLDMWYRI